MRMELFDTHCHLTSKVFTANTDAVIDRAVAAGVTGMITVGTDVSDSRAAATLAARRPEVWFAAGVHPHEAAKASPDDVAALARLWGEPRCVAAGEIGLDYHYDFSPRDVQRDWFARQLEVALAAQRPVIVHSREAFDDTVAILERHGGVRRPVVFHCFTGTPAEAADIDRRGWRLSFAGVVTFKKLTELQSIAAAYPVDRLMVETDAPYLSPEPVRNVRPNEPALVAHTVAFLARLRGVDANTLAAAATANARRFFAPPL